MRFDAVATGRWLVVILWLSQITMLLTGLAGIKVMMPWLLAIYLITIFQSVRTGTRRLTCALLAVAILLCWYSQTLAHAWQGLVFATAFPAFLGTMALLRATALVHPTVQDIRRQVSELRASDRESGFMIASHFLGAVVTAGTFGIIAPLAPANSTEHDRHALAIACLRGVNLAVFWSPFFVGMAVVTHYLPELPVWQIALQGGLMAFAAYAILLLPGGAEGRRGLVRAIGYMMPLAPPVLILAVLVIGISGLSGLGALDTVFLTVPPLIFGYLLFQPRAARGQAMRGCWQSLTLIKDELLLVSVVGVLSLSLANAPGADALVYGFMSIGLWPPLAAACMLVFILLLAMSGVHPMASASVILALLSQDGPLSQLTLAAIGLLGWGLGTIVSPGSITVLIASNLFDVLPGRLVFSRNLFFVFGFGILAVMASAILTS